MPKNPFKKLQKPFNYGFLFLISHPVESRHCRQNFIHVRTRRFHNTVVKRTLDKFSRFVVFQLFFRNDNGKFCFLLLL